MGASILIARPDPSVVALWCDVRGRDESRGFRRLSMVVYSILSMAKLDYRPSCL